MSASNFRYDDQVLVRCESGANHMLELVLCKTIFFLVMLMYSCVFRCLFDQESQKGFISVMKPHD